MSKERMEATSTYLTQSTSSTKKIFYSLSTIHHSYRSLKDEDVSSFGKTAAHTAEIATIDLRSEAPFNLFEMERRLIFGPFGFRCPKCLVIVKR